MKLLSRALGFAAVILLVYLAFHLTAITQAQSVAVPRTPTPRGPLGEEERGTIELFEKARRSVVYIATEQRVVDPWTRNPLQVQRGTGSGFVWDDAGHVVTNNHVIAGASGAQVRLADGRAFAAELVGTSPDHDLAVLRIRVDTARPSPLPIGTSHDLRVGQKVFAVGNPFGLDWTLTTGIVSALNRELPTEDGGAIRELIQTDAAINPGNSGGPLLDSAGRLVGVNSAIYSPSGAYAGIGFSVPVDTVNRVVPRLIATGHYERPSLGVRIDAQINEVLVERLKIQGVFVLAVDPGSPAAHAGLRPTRVNRDESFTVGDVIVAVGERKVVEPKDLVDALDHAAPGQQVRLTVLRAGQRLTIDVKLQGGA
jgi:S1-C subfamily serine protease